MAVAYAARYARALVDVLEAGNWNLEEANALLSDFSAAWEGNPGLRHVFLDPSYTAEKKISLLDKLNERLHMTKPLRDFLAVVIKHERMEGFRDILGEFERMVRGDLGIDKVEWTSARPLDEDQRQAVQARIHELTGKRVEATFTTDPAMLGGARLRIGSTVYDGSVRGKLEQLKERLAAS